jgi:ribose transport system substrate-binding protein
MFGSSEVPPMRLVLAAAALSLLAACGSEGTDSAEAEADTATAKSQLAEYSGKISEFTVDQPLDSRPPAGTEYAFLQCPSPTCGIIGDVLGGAAKALGVGLTVVKAGGSASEQQAAMDSIIAMEPDGVLIAGLDPTGIGDQIKQLTSDDVPVSTIGLQDTDQYGVQAPINSGDAQKLYGKLMASYVVAKEGGKAKAVVYEVPELSFAPKVTAAFTSEMKSLCPDCDVRKVDISLTTVGTSSPSAIVSDLQAHPETNVAVFTLYDAATGLPAAMKTAGLEVDTVGLSPSPSNLQDIKNGDLGAAVAVDLPVMIWSAMDATARIAGGQELTAGEKSGIPPVQMIEQDDITFDPTKGFSGYPDFVERFSTLWGL